MQVSLPKIYYLVPLRVIIVFFLFLGQLKNREAIAQTRFEIEQVKAVFVIRLSEEIGNLKRNGDTINILFLGKQFNNPTTEPRIFKHLRAYKNLHFNITTFTDITQLKKATILYITDYKPYDANLVNTVAVRERVLLITEDLNIADYMVNFYLDKGRPRFAVNIPKLRLSGFTVSNSISMLSENQHNAYNYENIFEEIIPLISEQRSNLERQRDTIELKTKELRELEARLRIVDFDYNNLLIKTDQQNAILKQKTDSLQLINSELTTQQWRARLLSDSLIHVVGQIEQKQQLLDLQQYHLDSNRIIIEKQSAENLKTKLLLDSLARRSNRIKQEMSEKAAELVALNLTIMKQERKISKQMRTINQQALLELLFGAIIVLMVAAGIGYLRYARVLKNKNNHLKEQYQEIQTQKEVLAETNTQLFYANQELSNQKEEIMAQRDKLNALADEVQQKNTEIMASITYAKSIQDALMPSRNKLISVFDDFFVYNKPKDIVSGDFFWFHKKGKKVFVAAIDCTGHGVPGAFMSVLANELLFKIVGLKGKEDPDEILNELRSEVRKAFDLNQVADKQIDEVYLSELMAISLCVFNIEKRKVHFSGSFMPMLLISDGVAQLISGDRNSIGGMINPDIPFTTFTFDYGKPAYFYLFSDGIADQFGGPNNKKFNSRRLRDLIFEIHQLSMHEQQAIITNTIDDWMLGQRQYDDMLLIGLKV